MIREWWGSVGKTLSSSHLLSVTVLTPSRYETCD